MEDDDEPVVCSESQVINHAMHKGIRVSEADDPGYWVIEYGGEFTFIPRAYVVNGYTQDEVDFIEDAFAALGVSFHPVDWRRH